MGTILSLQQRARKITPQKVKSDLFKFIKSIEDEIFDLNVTQLDNAEDSEGGVLINKDSRFSGVYSETTEEIAKLENPLLPKKAGELYNFGWFGDFLGNFEMTLFNDRVEIFSTGEGSGEKKAFFDGYKSMYGLTPESVRIIIDRRVKPFILQYYRKQLGL